MQIVIDIPEEEYNFVKKQVAVGNTNPLKICIANGTPLPKGHGRIVDISQIKFLKALHDVTYGKISWGEATKQIKNSAPTLVEADTENEDKCKKCEYYRNPDYTRCHDCKAESEVKE